MQRAIVVTSWIRYELARIYKALGFESAAMSDTDKLFAALPEYFTAQDVMDVKGCGKSQAYSAISHFVSNGLATKQGAALYRKSRNFTPDGWTPEFPELLARSISKP